MEIVARVSNRLVAATHARGMRKQQWRRRLVWHQLRRHLATWQRFIRNEEYKGGRIDVKEKRITRQCTHCCAVMTSEFLMTGHDHGQSMTSQWLMQPATHLAVSRTLPLNTKQHFSSINDRQQTVAQTTTERNPTPSGSLPVPSSSTSSPPPMFHLRHIIPRRQ